MWRKRPSVLHLAIENGTIIGILSGYSREIVDEGGGGEKNE